MQHKAWALARFFDFLVLRYQGDIQRLTGHVVLQPIDEFNRPAKADYGVLRVPPSDDEVEVLFAAWRERLPHARKYLPAARDYLAASLWRRAGLRISETYMLDIRDWRPDLGELRQAPRPVRQGQPRPGPQDPAGAGDQPGRRPAGLVADRRAAPVRRRLGRPGRAAAAERAPRPAHRPVPRVGDEALRDGLAHAVARCCRPGRAADPAYAAALLRVVAVCPGHGSQGDPGAARP